MEVLLACSILAILLSLSLTLSSSRQRSQKSAQALSEELASQLRWARERARARGAAVGVVFPRIPAPTCRSAQVFEGEVRARPLQRLNYSGDSECVWLGDQSAAAMPQFQPQEWIPANLRDQSWVVFLWADNGASRTGGTPAPFVTDRGTR